MGVAPLGLCTVSCQVPGQAPSHARLPLGLRVVQDPGHRAISGSAIRTADTGPIAKGMDRYDYYWVPKRTGFITDQSTQGWRPVSLWSAEGTILVSMLLKHRLFKAALLVLGLCWSFVSSYLDCKAPTNALMSMYYYQIIIYVGDQKLRTSY